MNRRLSQITALCFLMCLAFATGLKSQQPSAGTNFPHLHFVDSLFEHGASYSDVDVSGYPGYYSHVPEKFDFTGDGIPDYLLLWSGDERFIAGNIVDGTTGSHLNEYDHHRDRIYFMDSTQPLILFFNRPDHERLKSKVIDVNCGDRQKELLVIRDNGFVQMSGPESSVHLFRYNAGTHCIQEIFRHTIEFDPVAETSPSRREAYYIDLLYSDRKCVETIRVSDGTSSTSSGSDAPLDYKKIRPLKSSRKTTYSFDAKRNLFVKEK